MTAEFDADGFYDEHMRALGEITGYAGVFDHGGYLSPQVNIADSEAD